ncbi:hypothetical protein ACJRO7_026175 [Eucalyptus globulus]|uniref:Uncharacterized protein n=1 Tax=Eucalyptus globulus TaxID=34317 RepID=A0ABD3KHE5_EUCGL
MIERSTKDFGWAQPMQPSLVSLAGFFNSRQTFLSIFTGYCNSMSDVCRLPNNSSWQWDYPKHASIVSEWGLQCANSAIRGLVASSFLMGCLIGGLLLATLADLSLGRKNMLFLSYLSPDLDTTIGTCTLVLASELVGKKWRGSVGLMNFFILTLGFLSLPANAYGNQRSSWRALYIWTSVPAIGYCVLAHFLVCESPRWLFVMGHREEASETLKSIAPPSASAFTKDFSSISLDEDPLNNMDILSAIEASLEKKWAFRGLRAVMFVGFGTGMVYYGMPLGVTNLDFNLYSSVTPNALAELPSTLFYPFFSTFSGFCSLMCILEGQVWQKWQIGLELVSFFGGCTALDVLLIYILELFPTCVRNSAIAMVWQAVVFGVVFSPLLVATAGRRGDGVLSYGVFGLVIGCCGLFVLCLPEARCGNLCDTMDEEERKENERDSCILC